MAVDFLVVHALAALLLIAALGKAAGDSQSTYELVAWQILACVEGAAGALLVCLHRSATVRVAVGGLFLFLVGAALAQVWRGYASCNCLGRISAAPWQMLVFDLSAATWLMVTASAAASRQMAAKKSRRFAAAVRPAVYAMVSGVLITGGAAGASWIDYMRQANQPLRIDPAELEIGAIWLQEGIERQVSITNRSSMDYTIVLEPGCACTVAEPNLLRLRPGQSGSVNLQIDLFRIARENWAAGSWPLSIDLVAFAAGQKEKVASWKLSGEVVSPFSWLSHGERRDVNGLAHRSAGEG